MIRFGDDRDSGAGDVALAFLEELGRWVATDVSGSAPLLRASLLAWLREAQAQQPSMALIHQLAARALQVADTGVSRGDAPAPLRLALSESCAAEREDLEATRRMLAQHAASVVHQDRAWIATVSASGAVRDAVRAVERAGLKPRVLAAESRPRREGRALASALAEAGVPVWLVVDAALPLLISQAHLVWIGADAVTDRGVINKVGSYAAALAAREHSVPVYALAERRKFLPAGTGALKILEMPPSEVWGSPPAGVETRNVYFELVPMALLRGVVVEDGVLPPGEAAALARERPLPPELAAG